MSLANTPGKRRTYSSPLREQQAAATRDRILEGLIRTMANGLAEISMPAVAREAGVSVATVYRHFPNKQALFEELPAYIARRTGNDALHVPKTMAELGRIIHQVFETIDRGGETIRAAMDSPLGDEARRAQMPSRLRFLEAVVESLAPELREPTRGRIVRLMLVLTSSGAQRMLKTAGRGPAEAADDAFWALRAIIGSETAKT